MPALDTLLSFMLVSALLALAPGPDNIFVLTQSAVSGRKSGLLITLGLCTGLLVHTVVVAAGVAAVFQASEAAFEGLKIVGACYLLYLAWLAFRSSSQALNAQAAHKPRGVVLYRRGIIMNITNPKVAIFFLAFLPQFARPEAGSIPAQIMLFGVLFMVVAWVIFSTIAMLSGYLHACFADNPGTQRVLNKIAALVFVALALNLLLAGWW